MAIHSIDYLNARKALKPASGGKTYGRAVEYCPDSQLDVCEQTELKVDSLWSDYRIRAEVMWQGIFERLGLNQGYELEESF